jgi:hypothetical protein
MFVLHAVDRRYTKLASGSHSVYPEAQFGAVILEDKMDALVRVQTMWFVKTSHYFGKKFVEVNGKPGKFVWHSYLQIGKYYFGVWLYKYTKS